MARRIYMPDKEFLRIYCNDGSLTFDKNINKLYFRGQEVLVRDKPGKYSKVRVDGKQISIHRIIAYLKYGEAYLQPGIEARHLNDIKDDYRWDNIAIGTHKENMDDMPQEVWDRIHAVGIPALLAIDIGGNSKRWWSSLTPEQRSEHSRRGALTRESAMTFELKSERSKKGWLIKSGQLIGAKISAAHKRRDSYNKNNWKEFYEQRTDNELTLEQVYEIDRLQATCSYRYVDLAAMYGVHYNTIEKIINRRSRYKYIPREL